MFWQQSNLVFGTSNINMKLFCRHLLLHRVKYRSVHVDFQIAFFDDPFRQLPRLFMIEKITQFHRKLTCECFVWHIKRYLMYFRIVEFVDSLYG